MEYTSDNLENVVIEFYRNQESVNAECHEWLKSCQESREAWQIIWPLLNPEKILQVQFFAANVLHFKITRCFSEVPESDYLGLKENLIAAVARYVSGPSIILTRLGLSLGAFISNTIGPFWPNPLEDLGNIFQPQNFKGVPDTNVHQLLIQIFGFIPELAQTNWQHSERKKLAYREIQSKGSSMLTWLYSVVKSQTNKDLTMEGLKAMNSWMKMICICDWTEVKNFIDTLIMFTQNSANCESEEEFCELNLEILSSIASDPSSHLYPTLILELLCKVLTLQSSLDCVLQREDLELASSFYGLYIALADCHSKLIVAVCDEENNYTKSNPENRTNALKLIDLLLKCTNTPGIYPIEEIISNITISVWYSFVEDIQNLQSDKLTYLRVMLVFEWVYKNLQEILVKKGQYPLDTSDWNHEEMEQFRIYRQDVSDCLTYCFELRGWTVLNELTEMGEACIKSIEINPNAIITIWPELESILMGIRAVTENISDEADPLLYDPINRVFTIIFQTLKITHQKKIPRLFQSAIECISSCSGMLSSFEHVAKNVLLFILEALFEPDIVTCSCLALKTLSRDCSKCLSGFTPQILSSCKKALDSGKLSENDCNRLVYCIGKFLPYLPQEQIIPAIEEIFSPGITRLEELITVSDNSRQEIKFQLVRILNIMSTLCSSLDKNNDDDDDDEPSLTPRDEVTKPVDLTNHPLIPIIERLLPILLSLAENWVRDEEVMESIYSILKHTMMTIHNSSQSVLMGSIQIILLSFRMNPLASANSLAKQTLLMIGTEKLELQIQFLSELHKLGMENLKTAREQNRIEFAESFYNFMAQIIKNNHHLLISTSIEIHQLYAIAIESLNYPESQLLKAVIYFVANSIDKASIINQVFVDYIKLNGSLLLQKLLLGIGYMVPRTSVHYFADILLALNRRFTAEWRKWLAEVLQQERFPSPHVTSENKNIFYAKITKEKVNKRAMQDALEEFALSCRNLSGSEYAFATSKRI